MSLLNQHNPPEDQAEEQADTPDERSELDNESHSSSQSREMNPFNPAEAETSKSDQKRIKTKKAKSKMNMKMPTINLSKKTISNVVTLVAVVACAGYFYYEKGHVLSKDLPFTAYDLRMKANQQRMQELDLINANPQENQTVGSEPVPTAKVVDQVAQGMTDGNAANGDNFIPNVAEPFVRPSSKKVGVSEGNQAQGTVDFESHYLDKIDNLSTDLSLQQSLVNDLLSKLNRLESKNIEQDQKLVEATANLSHLRAELDKSQRDLSSALSKASSAEQSAKSMKDSVDSIVSASRESDRSIIKNELGIESIHRSLTASQSKTDDRLSSMAEKLTKLETVMQSKSHIESVPRRVQYLDGQSVTTVDPNVSIDTLRNYGAKVSEKIIPDYHLLYAANGRFSVIQPNGRQGYIYMGDSIGIYGQVMDFVAFPDPEQNYLVMSSGYKLTSEENKKWVSKSN